MLKYMHWITRLDSTLSMTILKLPQSWRPFFQAVTYAGEPIVMAGLLAVAGLALSRSGHRTPIWAAGWGIVAMLSINVIKLALRRSRPDTYTPLLVHSYSFPSAHSFASALALGLIAWMTWQTFGAGWGSVAAGLSVVGIVLVGVSRVYLGAHFPTDVLGGWTLAALAGIIINRLLHW